MSDQTEANDASTATIPSPAPDPAAAPGPASATAPVDDSIPPDANHGFDDTGGPPPPAPQPTFARTLPTANNVLDAMRSFLGIGEHPPGSNCNAITAWYGKGCVAWCAEAVSKACFDGGFNDGHDTWDMPGIAPTTRHGFAWVLALQEAFQAAGRFDHTPQVGDIFIVGNGDHTGIVESIDTNGILVHTIEGNYSDDCKRNSRTASTLTGFCHPPYQLSDPHVNVPPFHNVLRVGDTNEDVRLFQQRMATRGWTIAVDSQFGPQTEHVVQQFQSEKGLTSEHGDVGPLTWNAAWTAPIT